MKNLLLIIVLVPALTFAQNRRERRAQEKNNKITLANLQTHIEYLANDKLEGRRAGTQGELTGDAIYRCTISKRWIATKRHQRLYTGI